MIFAYAAAYAATDALPPGFSTPLLTWSGVIAVVLGLLLWGLLIPRSTHLREIRSIKEANAALIASYQAQLADKNAEITVLREVSSVKESTVQEVLAQHRLALDSTRTMVQAFDQIREELAERAPREATPR